MNALKATTVLYIGGAVVGLVAIAYLIRKGPKLAGAALANAGQAIAAAPIAAVKGIGAIVGIPDTDGGSCAAAIASNRMLDASFACPAKDFLAAAWSRVTGQPTSTAGGALLAAQDKQDADNATAMRDLNANPLGIDLGAYADNAAYEDWAVGHFAETTAFFGPTGPAIWDSNATARLLRRPVSVPVNSEYQ